MLQKLAHLEILLCLLVGLVYGRNHPFSYCRILHICGCCDAPNGILTCTGAFLGPYAPELTGVSNPNTHWVADFSHNEITILQNMSFYVYFEHVVYFRQLNYSHNYIHQIDAKAFQGQEFSLRVLKLNNNKLEMIPFDAFKNLTVLELLDISNNQLISMDFVCALTNSQLNSLDLNNNSITHIEPDCLNGTQIGQVSQSWFDISVNELVIWTDNDLQRHSTGLYNLTANSWICTCCISWLVTSLHQNLKCIDMEIKSQVLLDNYAAEEQCNQSQFDCNSKSLQLEGRFYPGQEEDNSSSIIIIEWTTPDINGTDTEGVARITVNILHIYNISLSYELEERARLGEDRNNTVHFIQPTSLKDYRVIACISMSISTDDTTLVTCEELVHNPLPIPGSLGNGMKISGHRIIHLWAAIIHLWAAFIGLNSINQII